MADLVPGLSVYQLSCASLVQPLVPCPESFHQEEVKALVRQVILTSDISSVDEDDNLLLEQFASHIQALTGDPYPPPPRATSLIKSHHRNP